jgi:hypothetical protein
MRKIKLSPKESKQLTSRMKKIGVKTKSDIKSIDFHKDFNKGIRIAVCKHCGNPQLFCGSDSGLDSNCSVCTMKRDDRVFDNIENSSALGGSLVDCIALLSKVIEEKEKEIEDLADKLRAERNRK